MADTETSGSSSSDENDGKQETAQQWIFRHLIEFTNCDDVSAKYLVDGDCSPLISLLTDMTQEKILFIAITKTSNVNMPIAVPLPIIPKNEVKEEKKIRTSQNFSKKKKRRRKREKKKKNKKAKFSKKTDDEEDKKKDDAPADNEPITFTIDHFYDYLFEWWESEEFPGTDQFIFIVPKTAAPNTDVEFDELYHIGYVKNQRIFRNALKCLEIIFSHEINNNDKEYKKLLFSMKIDLLLLIYGIDDRKTSRWYPFERFIVENIALNFNLDGRIRNLDVDARSITLILAQLLQQFCNQPDKMNACCVRIQLSFYDIEYLTDFQSIDVSARRLTHALKTIELIIFLFHDAAIEWCRKTFLYILDLFSTLLAQEITKKSNYMTNYTPNTTVVPICATFKKFVELLTKVNREVFTSNDDRAPTEKLSFSFHIVGILEEEMDSIISKVEEINSESRDMLMDRSTIVAANVILGELREFLQERCLESTVESGNLESLRSLATAIVRHNRRLERIVSLY